MPIAMQTIELTGHLRFLGFDNPSRLGELAAQIGGALGTEPGHWEGSPLELQINFAAFPKDFALWWDGLVCELGCSAPCGVDMSLIAEQLIASGMFINSPSRSP